MTLIEPGIGRDFISDFTTNLAFEFLLDYTQAFALQHLSGNQISQFSLRCQFDSRLMIWTPRTFSLPCLYLDDGDFVLLTPMDILTRDEAFICNSDLQSEFRSITASLENSVLRDAVNLFFRRNLPANPRKMDVETAILATIRRHPEILDYYIQKKEGEKDQAAAISREKVEEIRKQLIGTLSDLCSTLHEQSDFFDRSPTTSYRESLARAIFLKQVIEDNDGWRVFYHEGQPVASEDVVQRIFRLAWFESPYDVNSEVNNGRGPADYKVSFGSRDSCIVEFKLGKSSSLKRNLANQVPVYRKASRTAKDITVVLCYSAFEIKRVMRILRDLGTRTLPENIVLIDGTPKKSASKL